MASKQSYIDLMQNTVSKTLSDIPNSSVEQNIIDVTEMMNIPTSADVEAFMFRGADEHKHLIKLHGFDNSGQSGALVITPTLGYGAHYDAQLAQSAVYNNVAEDFIITLTSEDGTTNSTISVPQNCNSFDITYFAKQTDDTIASYYVDSSNVMHSFELENTPIENFYDENYTYSIVINGVSVNYRNNIKEICFGTSYNSITSYSYNNFLETALNIQTIDITGLKNLTTIGNNFISSCNSLQTLILPEMTKLQSFGTNFIQSCSSLTSVDLSSFTNVSNIGNYFLAFCSSLTSVDLSSFTNVSNIGYDMCSYCSSLNEIQIGGVDWSTKTFAIGADKFKYIQNTSSCIIYADTQDLATKFKTKIGNSISEWSIVINS
jgi:hypothetical protein